MRSVRFMPEVNFVHILASAAEEKLDRNWEAVGIESITDW